jgi:hypothetical protein
MKQVILLFLCVMAVLFLGSTMQKGNLDFGPVAAVEETIPQDTSGDEVLKASMGPLHFGERQQP